MHFAPNCERRAVVNDRHHLVFMLISIRGRLLLSRDFFFVGVEGAKRGLGNCIHMHWYLRLGLFHQMRSKT